MSEYLIQDSTLSGIASAIRTRTGVSSTFTPAQMASAILSIPSAHTVDVTLSENGIYLPEDYNADAFDQVNVMVPEPSMSAVTISANGTYRPSAYGADAFSQVTVNVSGGGGGGDATFKSYAEGTLTSINDGSISYIASRAFMGQSYISEAAFTAVTSIGMEAFAKCEIERVSFPLLTGMDMGAFYSCVYLEEFDGPSLQSLPISAFAECIGLSSASFSVATSIGSSAFYSCYWLQDISIPAAQMVQDGAFMWCENLSEISLPSVTTIGHSAFMSCLALESISIPSCQIISDNAFRDCGMLGAVNGPSLTRVSHNAFRGCVSLSMVSIGQTCTIGNWAFYGCSNLWSLYLTGSSVCNLTHSNAFDLSLIEGYDDDYGSIYVPASLYSDYISHSVWAVYSSRFVSIP